jgi:hypothetical protein
MHVLVPTLWLGKAIKTTAASMNGCTTSVFAWMGELQLDDSRTACTPSKVRWTLDCPILTLRGLDGFGYYEMKLGLDMDLATSNWTLVGHHSFGFGP